jgi:16S rRNA (uracil1498-N3)-methyltransferase
MSARFYFDGPLQRGTVELTGPEAHHLAAVCRLGPGDDVCLFNGDGHEYQVRVQSAGKHCVVLEVRSRATPERELPFALTVAAPLPKGDRAQFLVEKLTELGVTTFVPLATERSIIVPREAKLDKLRRYVIEASKQCGRNVLMSIAPLVDWTSYCRQQNHAQVRLIAHPGRDSAQPLQLPRGESVGVAIGPEGGFTDAEIALSQQTGWQHVCLGPRVLRVETAALMLAAWIIVGHARSAQD